MHKDIKEILFTQEQITERCNHNDQWKTQAHRTERHCTDLRDSGNIDAVHDVVEQT